MSTDSNGGTKRGLWVWVPAAFLAFAVGLVTSLFWIRDDVGGPVIVVLVFVVLLAMALGPRQ